MAQVRILGAVGLLPTADRPAHLAPRARRLLAALVSRANAVASVDWLTEAVWSEEQPGEAEAALQTLVSRLRASMKGADPNLLALVTRSPGYLLELDRSALDAWRLEDLAAQAQPLVLTAPARAADLLDEAAAWWRGDPYAEFGDADFAAAEVARLNELRLGIEEDRAEADVALGRHAAAAGRLERLVREHPLRERPVAQLMLSRVRAGQQADALAVFQSYRRRLVDELGLDPSARLTDLHSAILSDDPSLQADGDRVAVEPAPRIAGPVLVGRDLDCTELKAALRTERLITLTGPGGVGKTSLGRAVAAAVQDSYPDGVWWCGLGAVPSADAVLPALCSVLGAPGTPGQSPLEQLVSRLAPRRTLLLVDNCEHVIEEVSLAVREVLDRCAGVTVLATSRVPLQLPPEVVWPVAPLGLPPTDSATSAPASPAVELFLTRARQRARSFTVSEGEVEIVAELCRRLDGLPLAIELAAAQMGTLSPAQLVARLQWRFKMLHGGPAADPRHRTLRAMVDWSYALLEEGERRLFETLSVFAGVFRLSDAEELVETLDSNGSWDPADVVRSLGILVDHSMITVATEPGSFLLLETIKDYGRERQAERASGERVQRAHATMYARRSAATFGHLYGPLQLSDCRRLVGSLSEIRAAYTWSVEHDLELAAVLVGSQSILVEQLVQPEVAQWAVDLAPKLDPGAVGSSSAARVYALAAASARYSGDFAAGQRWIDRASVLAGDPATACYTSSIQCELAFFRGDLDHSTSFGDRILAIVADHPELEPYGQIALVERSLIMTYRGDPVAGAELAAEAQRECERRGWPVPAAWALYARGEALITDDPPQADLLLGEALERARQIDERYLTGVTLVSLASVRGRHGDPGAALALFAEVVRHWRDRDDWTHQWTTLRNVVELFGRLGRLDVVTVVVTALNARSELAVGFGTDAARLTETSARLIAELAPDRLATLEARGRSLGDQQLVAFVLDELDIAAGPLSAEAGRTERTRSHRSAARPPR